MFLIASGGVVDKLIRCLIYHPVCASKEGGLFLYGAAQPPLLVQEGKLAGRHIARGSLGSPDQFGFGEIVVGKHNVCDCERVALAEIDLVRSDVSAVQFGIWIGR